MFLSSLNLMMSFYQEWAVIEWWSA